MSKQKKRCAMKALAVFAIALGTAMLACLAQSACAQSLAPRENQRQMQSAQQAQLKAQLTQQVKQALQGIVPSGLRLTSVRLECNPPDGATIKQVAPGIESLSSPGFTVELDSPQGTIYCSATAKVQAQVLVAAHGLSAGQTVSKADFRIGWADAFTGSPDALSTLDGRAVMLVPLRAGSVVHSSDLCKAIAIHSGEIVAVTVRNGAVTVVTHLKAVNDAGEGESVTLENPTSGRLVVARAVAPGHAEINLLK
jgi:flagella basal body P-ring formation protein FlgA